MTEQDVFLDVGCGKGRVLAYLLKSHAPCRLCGIEINEISGRTAQEWTQKYDRVDVMIGDALIYWVDQQSGYMLKDRPGWEKQFGEKLKTLCGLKIAKVPQSYSIWVYDPNRRVADKDANTSDV